MNRKGQSSIMGILLFVGILFVVLIAGLGLAFGGTIVDWVFDEVVPEVSTLGQVGSSNLTAYAEITVKPVNQVVQSINFMSGVVYVMALLGILGFAVAFRFTGSKWLMALFFALILLLIIASIFISNIYEEFYNGTDEMATRLQENQLLSFMILYGPMIMSLVAIVGGIIMFTGNPEESQGL